MDIGNQRIGLVILSLMKMDGYFMKCWSGFMFLQTWKDFGFGRRSLAGFGRKKVSSPSCGVIKVLTGYI